MYGIEFVINNTDMTAVYSVESYGDTITRVGTFCPCKDCETMGNSMENCRELRAQDVESIYLIIKNMYTIDAGQGDIDFSVDFGDDAMYYPYCVRKGVVYFHCNGELCEASSPEVKDLCNMIANGEYTTGREDVEFSADFEDISGIFYNYCQIDGKVYYEDHRNNNALILSKCPTVIETMHQLDYGLFVYDDAMDVKISVDFSAQYTFCKYYCVIGRTVKYLYDGGFEESFDDGVIETVTQLWQGEYEEDADEILFSIDFGYDPECGNCVTKQGLHCYGNADMNQLRITGNLEFVRCGTLIMQGKYTVDPEEVLVSIDFDYSNGDSGNCVTTYGRHCFITSFGGGFIKTNNDDFKECGELIVNEEFTYDEPTKDDILFSVDLTVLPGFNRYCMTENGVYFDYDRKRICKASIPKYIEIIEMLYREEYTYDIDDDDVELRHGDIVSIRHMEMDAKPTMYKVIYCDIMGHMLLINTTTNDRFTEPIMNPLTINRIRQCAIHGNNYSMQLVRK